MSPAAATYVTTATSLPTYLPTYLPATSCHRTCATLQFPHEHACTHTTTTKARTSWRRPHCCRGPSMYELGHRILLKTCRQGLPQSAGAYARRAQTKC